MVTRRQMIGLTGFGTGLLVWWAGLGGPLALLVGLVVTAVLFVALTRPAGVRRSGETGLGQYDQQGWGFPATNMLLWSGVLFGWANGTGGSGAVDPLEDGMSGGGFDAGGGFDGGGGDGGGGSE